MYFSTARPSDKQTIEYLIHIGKILSNDQGDGGSADDQNLNKDEILAHICTVLGMTDSELKSCQGKTILSTARQTISKKYPNASTTFADVLTEHIQAAAGK